jgi:hypothetical protein
MSLFPPPMMISTFRTYTAFGGGRRHKQSVDTATAVYRVVAAGMDRVVAVAREDEIPTLPIKQGVRVCRSPDGCHDDPTSIFIARGVYACAISQTLPILGLGRNSILLIK